MLQIVAFPTYLLWHYGTTHSLNQSLTPFTVAPSHHLASRLPYLSEGSVASTGSRDETEHRAVVWRGTKTRVGVPRDCAQTQDTAVPLCFAVDYSVSRHYFGLLAASSHRADGGGGGSQLLGNWRRAALHSQPIAGSCSFASSPMRAILECAAA